MIEPHACDRCGTVYDETGGDGYCGLCPSCADFEPPHVVVIPCSGRKMGHACQAQDMYFGSYYRACRRAAEQLRPERTLILSAMHGLVRLDEVIEPYDLRLKSAKDAALLGGMVSHQLRRHGLTGWSAEQPLRAVVLGGRWYVETMRRAFGLAMAYEAVELVTPLDGCRGIGDQLRRLASIREHMP